MSGKIGANITVGVGVSIDIDSSIDSKGNRAVQWSYSLPSTSKTTNVGIIDAGVGIQLQLTNAPSVKDLEGSATYIGASAGPSPWYVGADVITFDDPKDSNASFDGIQIQGGFGVGLDVHIVQSETRTIWTNQK